MVLHYLRHALHRQPGVDFDGVSDRPDGFAPLSPSHVPDPYGAPPPRSGQVPAGAGHGVGILFVFAVPDYLGGQPARRNSLVSDAAEWRLGIRRSGFGAGPFRAALRPAALARPEAQFQAAGRHRRLHSVHAHGGPLLAGGAQFQPEIVPRKLDGYHRAHRPGGIWMAYFLTQLEKRPLMPLNDPHLEEALEHGRE